MQLIINDYLKQKQSKFNSLLILSGCQTYCVFLFCSSHTLKDRGLRDLWSWP